MGERNDLMMCMRATLTSLVHGPLMRSGFRTFCQRWRHCTSDLSSNRSETFFQFLPCKHDATREWRRQSGVSVTR